MPNNIVVVGYPKSGNTWLTQLVAELVNCPVAGFWGAHGYREPAQEGEQRVSDYVCYKAHQEFDALLTAEPQPPDHIIYVVRDPRDVAISGAHYFSFDRWGPRLRRFSYRRRVTHSLYSALLNQALYKALHPEPYRIDKMLGAVLYGGPHISKWCAPSWRQHYRPYCESGLALVVRYEDLRFHPEDECRRILAKIGLTRTPEQVASAIHNQSFVVKKDAYQQSGNLTQVAFMRDGRPGQWREKLTSEQKITVSTMLGEDLSRLGYDD